MTEMEEDPYAVSSDTDTESLKGPPPKISIEGRSVADISSLVCLFKLENELAFEWVACCAFYRLNWFYTERLLLSKLSNLEIEVLRS